MSPVYWGIVASLLAMVVVLLVCLQIVSRGAAQSGTRERQDSPAEGTGQGSKHAA